jgi:hypothetical protein
VRLEDGDGEGDGGAVVDVVGEGEPEPGGEEDWPGVGVEPEVDGSGCGCLEREGDGEWERRDGCGDRPWRPGPWLLAAGSGLFGPLTPRRPAAPEELWCDPVLVPGGFTALAWGGCSVMLTVEVIR